AALQVRERTGRGQMVDVALVDSVFTSLENIPQKVYVDGEVPARIGNRYEFVYPYDSFEASDGWVIIGIANDAIWGRFVEATGLEELASDERFTTNPKRVENHGALKPLIQGWVSTRKVGEVVSFLTERGVPACPIYDLKEASEDPQIVERGMTVELEQPGLGRVRLLGSPVKMSETWPLPRGPAPTLGGDNISVLGELLGASVEEIARLRREGVL
ncbi:MAG: CoA transferase, partial [Candidatus Bathyarchaeota archaeon]|nr:CoA transferase [Candidatus Bathyarchaeota archaeon]